ncbi:hypothetical protein BHE74_00033762 [Ensete ventricosum]|nr:hypothetical protein BHE74_00033762 [Ensete ventricosum]
MLGRSQVRASDQGLDDAMGVRQEFAGGQPRFRRCCQELVENSPEVYREVHREFARRMLEVCWEFTEGNREIIGGSSERCQEFAKETIGQRRLYVEYRSEHHNKS